MRAFCELSEDGRKIEVYFPYSKEAVASIKGEDGGEGVPGRRFVPAKPGSPAHWTVPATLTSARRLRDCFPALELGDAVKAWGREQTRAEANLREVSAANDAKLERVPLDRAEWLRPYQRADVRMMSLASVGNFNQPGVGKTVETIYAVVEAGVKGPHIVVCPTSLFKDPWRDELAAHAPNAKVFWGSTPEQRRSAIIEVAGLAARGEADDAWLLINPEMMRLKKLAPEQTIDYKGKIVSKDHKGNAYVPKDAASSALFSLARIGALTADEFHKFGLGADRNTLYARGLDGLAKLADRRYALSGTPIGGKSIRLWGVLHFIEPDLFTSKWRWAEEWLEIESNGFGKKIGELKPGREQAFEQAHAKHIVRRSRASALPGMPPKQIIDVWCDMTPKQSKSYEAFARAAEVSLEGGDVTANGILAEYARMKQFANALCEIRDGKVVPTPESAKLPALLDRLDSFGVRASESEPNARAIVASESKQMVDMTARWLKEQGLNVRVLSGDVTGEQRDEVIDWYKADSDDARTLVMTTQTGGVGLNLGMTDVICILDETWNPDDQEQLEDRGMRDRETPLIVLYFRTRGTIQETIQQVAAFKKITNRNIVDIREALRARRSGARA